MRAVSSLLCIVTREDDEQSIDEDCAEFAIKSDRSLPLRGFRHNTQSIFGFCHKERELDLRDDFDVRVHR
jgi:hypothetical protein